MAKHHCCNCHQEINRDNARVHDHKLYCPSCAPKGSRPLVPPKDVVDRAVDRMVREALADCRRS